MAINQTTAKGFFTIIDYNDGSAVRGSINYNNPATQIISYDGSNVHLSNYWTSENPLILEGSLYDAQGNVRKLHDKNGANQPGTWEFRKSGGSWQAISTLTNVLGSKIATVMDATSPKGVKVEEGKEEGSLITGPSIDNTGLYTENTDTVSILKINGNLLGGSTTSIEFKWTASTYDEDLDISLDAVQTVTFTLVENGSNVVIPEISSIDGGYSFYNTFSASGDKNKKIKLKAQLLRGAKADRVYQFTWYKVNSPNDTVLTTGVKYWTLVSGGADTEVVNYATDAEDVDYSTLEIDPSMIDGSAYFYCVIKDKDPNRENENDFTEYTTEYATIYDYTDPFVVEIGSSNGDKLKNGQGFMYLVAKVLDSLNEEIDADGSTYSYNWNFYDMDGNSITIEGKPDGADYRYPTNTTGCFPTELDAYNRASMQGNKVIAVGNKDIKHKMTVWCTVSKKVAQG